MSSCSFQPAIHPERNSECSGVRHSVFWEKPAEQDFRQIFSEDFTSPILTVHHVQMSSKIINGDICSLWLAVTFMRLAAAVCKNVCLITCSCLTKLTYILTFPPRLQSSFLGLSKMLFPRLQSSFKSPQKLNSQLLHCSFFFFNQCRGGEERDRERESYNNVCAGSSCCFVLSGCRIP